jgi:glycosyltransferase involved in cell wall biosynthesis
MRPRLGVLDFKPIQYHTPLYQRLESRGVVGLDVMYLTDGGYRTAMDRDFGVSIAWDIDLLSGYEHAFLARGWAGRLSQTATLGRWLTAHDALVIHGYSNPWMLYAIAACRARGIPYLLRGDSLPDGQSAGLRRALRDVIATAAVSGSAAGLAIGQFNEQFYQRYGARKVIFAPYSVDDGRFACPPATGRSELLARWGLPDARPVVMYCGKMYPGKRPLDLTAAIRLLPFQVNTLFVGDGVLADSVRSALVPGEGVVTGFVNQSELPAYYHAADVIVLPSEVENWGLVLNEAMAAGVLPVVSDRVGAVPDLVDGLGETYPCGDRAALAAALSRALARAGTASTRDRVKRHVSRYSLDETAAGFEAAARAVCGS